MTTATPAPPVLHPHSTTTPGQCASNPPASVGGPARTQAFSTSSYSAAVVSPTMSIAIGGEYAALKRGRPGPPERRDWKRAAVTHFSARSRSRMLQSLAKTDRRELDGRAVFVTLTYPEDYPESSREWKRDLEVFGKRLRRMRPNAWWYWKLEPQRRGAPHFHLLTFGLQDVDRGALKTAWQETIQSEGRNPWTYGCWVQPMLDWRQAGRYASKYCAKIVEGVEWDHPGRYWGIMGRANRREQVVRCPVSEEEFYRVRRVFRALLGARRGYHPPGGADSGVWVRAGNETAKRALEWASSAPSARSWEFTDPETGCIYGRDMPTGGSDSSSTVGSSAGLPSPTGHTSSTSSDRLFDESDLQRRHVLPRRS